MQQDGIGVSQPTVSRAISVTQDSLTSPGLVSSFIRFPTNGTAIRKNQEGFFCSCQIPRHCRCNYTRHPHPNHSHTRVIRHHYHSINKLVVFYYNSQIIDIVAKWPGSTHDSRILNESALRVLFEQNLLSVHTHLLGDSGYPSKQWLLTPFSDRIRRTLTGTSNYRFLFFVLIERPKQIEGSQSLYLF